MKEFVVNYDIKGTRTIQVYIEDNKSLPLDWQSMSSEAQDEWLYENSKYSVLKYEDIDYGKAVSVLEVKTLGQLR